MDPSIIDRRNGNTVYLMDLVKLPFKTLKAKVQGLTKDVMWAEIEENDRDDYVQQWLEIYWSIERFEEGIQKEIEKMMVKK